MPATAASWSQHTPCCSSCCSRPATWPCLALVAALAAFSGKAKADAHGSSKGSRASQQQRQQQALLSSQRTVPAWQRHVSRMQRLLDPCHRDLFGILGVDSTLLLWAAAMIKDDDRELCLATVQSAQDDLLTYCLGAGGLQHLQQQDAEPATQCELHLLLARMQLQWAVREAAATGDPHTLGLAAASCCTAMQGLELLQELQKQAGVKQQLQHLLAGLWREGSLRPVIKLQIQLLLRLDEAQKLAAAAASSAAAQQTAAGPDSSSKGSSGAAGAAAASGDGSGSRPRGCVRPQCTPTCSVTEAAVRGAVLSTMGFVGRLLQLCAYNEQQANGYVIVTLPEAIVMVHDAAAVTEGFLRVAALHLQTSSSDGSEHAPEVMHLLRVGVHLVRRWDLQPGSLTALCSCSGSTTVLLPSSKEQRQLNSLLCSLVKLCVHTLHKHSEPLAGYGVMAAATTAIELLAGQQTSFQVVDEHLMPMSAAAAAVMLPLIPSQADESLCSADMGDAVSCLPRLVNFGRCCLYWAEQLEQQLPDMLQHLAKMLHYGKQPQVTNAAAASGTYRDPVKGWVVNPFHTSYLIFCAGHPVQGSAFAHLPQMLQSWLQKQHVVRELSAASYKPQQLLQQLHTLLAAHKAALDIITTDSEPLTALVCHLRAVGRVLTALAVPLFCNNPSCRNMSRLTELQLVSGRSAICAGCRTARYCCKQCQRLHWKQHKPVCKALAAAYAANNTAGSQ